MLMPSVGRIMRPHVASDTATHTAQSMAYAIIEAV